MRTVFIVMDSLNRHYLPFYNSESWLLTPNLQRLADRSLRFCNHYSGSLPCMPARREMMTGRYNFLETPWGPIEPWDRCLPTVLREQKGVYSHLITDHYHYFHKGGCGYHDLFDSWEFERGQEGDVWRPLVKRPEPEAERGKSVNNKAYWRNRQFMDPEDELSYPTPRCFNKAAEFMDINHDEDNWHLHLEVFDPHEPFDCPQKYRDLFDDKWDRKYFTWPQYDKLDPEHDDAETVSHIRKCYAGALAMADAWLGRLLDKFDEYDMWADTAIILSTDHGHLLGEHGYWAKNYMFDYQELVHIPLLVSMPGLAGGQTRNALTATIDIMPTLLDLHGAEAPCQTHGKSFKNIIAEDGKHHDAVLYGYFGKDVNMTDGRYTYCRQPLPDSTLYLHTGTPGDFRLIDRELLKSEDTETGSFLKSAPGIPVYRIKRTSKQHKDAPDGNLVYDISDDPGQRNPVDDPELEKQLAGKMNELLLRADAPECQFERLGF